MLSGGLAETTSGDFTGDFTAAVSRGGLLKPSDLLLMTSLHACSFWSKIRKDEDLRKMLLATTNPKEVFVGCLISLMTEDINTKSILSAKCKKGHLFKSKVAKILGAIFNACAKNLVEEYKSTIHASKKRSKGKKPTSSLARKKRKLTSGGSTATTTSTPPPPSTTTTTTVTVPKVSAKKQAKAYDCGTCKFCLDKKKNGGKGTLKKKCVNKN